MIAATLAILLTVLAPSTGSASAAGSTPTAEPASAAGSTPAAEPASAAGSTLAAEPEAAAGTDAPAATGAALPAACPPSKLYPPVFPPDMMRSGKSGVARVRAHVDVCGRVLSVELAESSGHPALNAAALAAVSGYVLTPAMAARAVNGLVVLPIRFGKVQTVDLQKPDWPRSHARPRYVADDQPIGFASVAGFQQADTLRDGPALEPPYGASRQRDGGLVVTWFQRDRTEVDTWWLSYTISHAPPPLGRGPMNATVAIVRYRLGEQDGEPVVRVAILCERGQDECESLRGFIMKGLPFARPRR